MTDQSNFSLEKYSEKSLISADTLNSVKMSFLPRLILLQAGSKDTNTKEKRFQGEFIIKKNKTSYVNLGTSVDIIPLIGRDKAVATKSENYETSFVRSSPVFRMIEEKSKIQNSGNIWGVEFLFYVNDFGLATYYASSVSARNSISDIVSYKGKRTTMTSDLRSNSKGQFFVPILQEAAVSFDITKITPQELDAAIAKFISEVESERAGAVVEVAPEDRER